jgi:fermentation-respiration switch protein FrsA (DUF1100 family)
MVWLLAILALVYSAFVAMLTVQQEKLIFRPHRGRVSPPDWGLADFRVVQAATADGLALDCWYRPADGLTKPTIALFPGNAGHPGLRADKARGLADAGYGVLIAGYRGYAGNDGEPSEKGLLADGRAALDFLVGQGISGRRLVIWGESLGTGIALPLAVERGLAALILEAPFTSLADVAARRYSFVPVRALLRHRFNSAAFMADVRAPVLILHGRADRTIPVALGEALEALATATVTAWRPVAGGHTDLMAHGAMAQVLAFLGGTGGKAPPVEMEQVRPGGRALIVRP